MHVVSLHDSLLRGILYIGKLHSIAANPEQAIFGLPLEDGRLTPVLVEAACRQIGLDAKVTERSVDKIHPAVLPVLIPLTNGDAFVMTEWRYQSAALGTLFVEGVEDDEIEIQADELSELSSGIVILVKRRNSFENRVNTVPVKRVESHWFWGALWKFKSVYWRVAIATIFINMMALASSLFVMNVYDRVVPNQATDTLLALAIGVIVVFFMEFGLKAIRTCMVDRAGRRVDIMLGGDVFAKVLSTCFHSRPASAGALAGQARAYESLREFFTSATVGALVDLPFVLLFAVVVYLLGGMAVIPLIAGILVALATSTLIQYPMKKAADKGYLASNQRYALMVESVNALETIKATGSESHLQGRMEDCVKESALAEGKSRAFSQLGGTSLSLIGNLVSAFTVVVAYFEVVNHNMSMGAMIACVILAGRAMQPLSAVSSLFLRLQQSLRSLTGLNEMMEVEDERHRKERISLNQFSASVSIENLKFGFGNNSEGVLKGLNIEIQPGEKVAILGKIGCGKTTLLRLLMALYDPAEGSIRISGLDTRQWSAPALRKHLGYLPQDSTLMYGTIKTNLIAGCEGVATDDDLQRAVELAELTQYLASLPDGFASPVSEGGRSLSGGQRQSLFLARAFMRSPEILLLDEPTSSMDLITEKKVLKNIAQYCDGDPNRTLIVATHRRSVLSIVDRVIVLDQGAVISDGPKESVIPQRKRNDPSAVRPDPYKSDSDSVALSS